MASNSVPLEFLEGTIARIIDDGRDGTPWKAAVLVRRRRPGPAEEVVVVVPPPGPGDPDTIPTGGVGDDIALYAGVHRERGRPAIAVAEPLDPNLAWLMKTAGSGADLRRSLTVPSALPALVDAMAEGDLAGINVEPYCISLVRPVAANKILADIGLRHQDVPAGFDDRPVYLLNDSIYARGTDSLVRVDDATQASVKKLTGKPQDPKPLTPKAVRVYPGNKARPTDMVEFHIGQGDCSSHTRLCDLVGSSVLTPRQDVRPATMDAFVSLHEFAHIQDPRWSKAFDEQDDHFTRKKESFSDAFAAMSLVMGAQDIADPAERGLLLREVDRIVAAREAALLAGDTDHVSGPAARRAYDGARQAMEAGERWTTVEMLAKADVLADDLTLGDKEIKRFQKDFKAALGKGRETAGSIGAILARLVAEDAVRGFPSGRRYSDELAASASSVARQAGAFWGRDDMGSANNAKALQDLKARSLADGSAALAGDRSTEVLAALMAIREKERAQMAVSLELERAYGKLANKTLLGRLWNGASMYVATSTGTKRDDHMRAFLLKNLPAPAGGGKAKLPNAVLVRDRILRDADAAVRANPVPPASRDEGAVLYKVPMPEWRPPRPNPWTQTLDQNLRACAGHLQEARRLADRALAAPEEAAGLLRRYRRAVDKARAYGEALTLFPADEAEFRKAMGWRDGVVDDIKGLRTWYFGKDYFPPSKEHRKVLDRAPGLLLKKAAPPPPPPPQRPAAPRPRQPRRAPGGPQPGAGMAP